MLANVYVYTIFIKDYPQDKPLTDCYVSRNKEELEQEAEHLNRIIPDKTFYVGKTIYNDQICAFAE